LYFSDRITSDLTDDQIMEFEEARQVRYQYEDHPNITPLFYNPSLMELFRKDKISVSPIIPKSRRKVDNLSDREKFNNIDKGTRDALMRKRDEGIIKRLEEYILEIAALPPSASILPVPPIKDLLDLSRTLLIKSDGAWVSTVFADPFLRYLSHGICQYHTISKASQTNKESGERELLIKCSSFSGIGVAPLHDYIMTIDR
jgi:hypothetical protein